MEQDFQTSFIPKKPIIASRAVTPRPINFLTIIAFFIFLAMLLATGILFFYKGITVKNIAKMENDLNLAKNRFEPSKITQLQVLDKRLSASSEVLSKHVAISPIFKALELITMKTVRYTKFGYEFGPETNYKIMVKMNGLAVGYRSVALQSDLFTKNTLLIDPVFSNLSLDDKGNVLFDLDFSVDPSLVDYKQMLKIQSANPGDANQPEEGLVN